MVTERQSRGEVSRGRRKECGLWRGRNAGMVAQARARARAMSLVPNGNVDSSVHQKDEGQASPEE